MIVLFSVSEDCNCDFCVLCRHTRTASARLGVSHRCLRRISTNCSSPCRPRRASTASSSPGRSTATANRSQSSPNTASENSSWQKLYRRKRTLMQLPRRWNKNNLSKGAWSEEITWREQEIKWKCQIHFFINSLSVIMGLMGISVPICLFLISIVET